MTRGARAARGTAIAVFATFVASLAHTLGGGAPPGPVPILVALAFSVPLAMLITGVRAKLVRSAVAALVAQAALHLTYAMGGAAPIAPGSHHEHAAHAGSGDAAWQLAATPIDHGEAWMPVAHVVAAAITLTALVVGDRVGNAIVRAIGVLVRRLTTIPLPVSARTVLIQPESARPRLIGALLSSGLGSRGPPVVSAAA